MLTNTRAHARTPETVKQLDALTPVQIAGLTGTSLKSVYKWIHTGKLKAEKIGNSWTIKKTDLETFLKARRGNDVAM